MLALPSAASSQTAGDLSTSSWNTQEPWAQGGHYSAQLAAGEQVQLPLRLAADTYLELSIEGSVQVTVQGPRGEDAYIYPRRGATQQLLWIEPSPASPREVLISGLQDGAFELKVSSRHSAAAVDRARLLAYSSYVEGRRLAATKKRDSIERALQLFTESLEAWRLIGEDVGLASTRHNRGSALVALGRFDEALAAYDAALEDWRRAGHVGGQVDSLRALGTAYFSSGRPEAAVEPFHRALTLKPALRQELALRQGLGAVYRSLGQPREALLHLGRAQEISSQPQSGVRPAARALLLNSVGLLYLDLGEAQRAVDALDEALALAQQAENRRLEAATVNNLASADWALGERQRARQRYETSLELHRELADDEGETRALNNLGWVSFRLGQYAEAQKAFEQTLQRARQEGHQRLVAVALDNLAQVDLAQVDLAQAELTSDRLDSASARLQQALPLRRATYDRLGEVRTLTGLAQVEQRKENWQSALNTVGEALEILESMRAALPDPDLRSTYIADHRQVYELQVELMLEMHRREPGRGLDVRAFEAAERARARSLLELLSEARIEVEAGIAPHLKAEEQRLSAALSDIQHELMGLRAKPAASDVGNGDTGELDANERNTGEDGRDDGSHRDRLRERWLETREQLELLERRVRLEHPRYADLQYPRPPSLEEVQSLLSTGTALLEYSLGERRSYLFCITAESFEVFPLPPADEIAAEVRRLRQGLEQPSRRALIPALAAGYELFSQLVEPAMPTLQDQGIDHLVISPDQVLHYLTFEALISQPPRGSRQLADESWLLRDFAISYTPSASILVSLADEPSEPVPTRAEGPVLVAFADPEVPQPEGAHSGAAEDTTDSESTRERAPSARRQAIPQDPALQLPAAGNWAPPPLPYSRREAQEIAAIFPPQETQLFLADQAREDIAKQNPAVLGAQRLHFATHAVTSHRQPRYSGLVLSLPGQEGEDGLLQVYEIFNLRLRADLVTLSACETGLGREVGGEGLLGLTQAFFYSGASNLVVSLWRVADRSTAELMVDFYRAQLGADEEVPLPSDTGRLARALQQAKLEQLQHPDFAHPFHWAPFILIGRAPSSGDLP